MRFYRSFYRLRTARTRKEHAMKGYVAKKGNRWYAVIYEGLDPITGRERRSWHAAGTLRADAERLAARLASELDGRNDRGPVTDLRRVPHEQVAAGQAAGARRHRLRRLSPQRREPHRADTRPNRHATTAAHHLEALYERLLRPTDDTSPLSPKPSTRSTS